MGRLELSVWTSLCGLDGCLLGEMLIWQVPPAVSEELEHCSLAGLTSLCGFCGGVLGLLMLSDNSEHSSKC